MDNSKLIKQTEDFVKARLINESTGHDWWHAVRVSSAARSIHKIEGGDFLVIELATLLHDVGDRKVINKPDDDYTIAEAFLSGRGVSADVIEQVMFIIKNMSFSKSLDGENIEKPIELQIVQDADRLDAIGAIGIARTFSFGGSRGRPLFDPSYVAQDYQSSEEYKKSKGSSYHHFEEKLLKLKDLMNTKAATDIAQKRDEFMRIYLRQFIDECNGVK